jgi:cation diffusion facilitator family transporter
MTQVHHDHTHDDHDHVHDDHDHSPSLWSILAQALHLPGSAHSHDHAAASDPLYASDLGQRTVQWAFVLLALTTALQVVIYLSSGSVALLADTVHNLGDALNSIPLWIAFLLMRRAPNRRYTYGYGRAEDLAGVLIVLSIVFSAGFILWESFDKLLHPQPLVLPGWVALAAMIGFVGNEAVALLQIRVGEQIGSDAMIADGQHARTDGLTSLAVLAAVIGTWLGFPILDPLLGLLIGVMILFISRDAAVSIWHRLMDAVDPAFITQAEQVFASHPEIEQVVRLQMRWSGHRLYASAMLALDSGLSLSESEAITDHVRHHLLHDLPHLYDVQIAAVPCHAAKPIFWQETGHHHAIESTPHP